MPCCLNTRSFHLQCVEPFFLLKSAPLHSVRILGIVIKPSHASKILPVDLHITVYNLHYPTDCFPPLSDQCTLEDCGVILQQGIEGEQ